MDIDFCPEDEFCMDNEFHTVVCSSCGEFVADFLYENEAQNHLREHGNMCPRCNKEALIIRKGD